MRTIGDIRLICACPVSPGQKVMDSCGVERTTDSAVAVGFRDIDVVKYKRRETLLQNWTAAIDVLLAAINEEYDSRPILWMEPGAIFTQVPDLLFQMDAELGLCVDAKDGHFLSSPIYIEPTKQNRVLVNRWVIRNESGKYVGEQSLRSVWMRMKRRPSTMFLPDTYAITMDNFKESDESSVILGPSMMREG